MAIKTISDVDVMLAPEGSPARTLAPVALVLDGHVFTLSRPSAERLSLLLNRALVNLAQE